ncbi:hypothetical protein AJ85_13325 [Alkalihalobacillus alcalophilus ATCC 27647 = CGMCC 1.3604]|uniref:Uncharacterized protein n=1 Tax=Alkalihalobacillus alcalophilus ATCC 27647 = CGMCC 1.3604 TaxID=1218173 RepID=A0A4S4JXW7_ALKAL|nr:hypothetical protein AJ85_13325 [Alkalihalobacillus alcalophilus ATCC 27647 = CGMCC 1.3604]
MTLVQLTAVLGIGLLAMVVAVAMAYYMLKLSQLTD